MYSVACIYVGLNWMLFVFKTKTFSFRMPNHNSDRTSKVQWDGWREFMTCSCGKCFSLNTWSGPVSCSIAITFFYSPRSIIFGVLNFLSRGLPDNSCLVLLSIEQVLVRYCDRADKKLKFDVFWSKSYIILDVNHRFETQFQTKP